jgi:hypothetical protein
MEGIMRERPVRRRPDIHAVQPVAGGPVGIGPRRQHARDRAAELGTVAHPVVVIEIRPPGPRRILQTPGRIQPERLVLRGRHIVKDVREAVVVGVGVIALLARHRGRNGCIVEPDLVDEIVGVIGPPGRQAVRMVQRFHQTTAANQVVVGGEADGGGFLQLRSCPRNSVIPIGERFHQPNPADQNVFGRAMSLK